jgi:hypothetical protein
MPKKRTAGTAKKSGETGRSRATAKRERFGEKSLAELRGYGKVLAEEAARLDEICRHLAETQTAGVGFDGINRIEDAVQIVYAFIDAVEMAARKEARARRSRGVE